MNFNTVLILIGILFGFVLIIENMIVPLQAYVLIWITKTWILAVVGITTGILLGYGLRGKSLERKGEGENDDFEF